MMSASAVAMRGEMGGGGGEGGEEELEDELEALLSSGGGQRRRPADSSERERERELSMFRSGSAPPTIEGSLNAISGLLRGDGEVVVTAAPIPVAEAVNGHSGLFSEEELRADPAYLSCYYSHGNLNPRLLPPVLSKEDWRSTQRLKSGGVGGIGDKRKPIQEDAGQGPATAVGRSLFSLHPGFEREEEARNDGGGAAEWVDGGGDGLIGLSLGRQRSFADMLQDNIGRRTPTSSPSFLRSWNVKRLWIYDPTKGWDYNDYNPIMFKKVKRCTLYKGWTSQSFRSQRVMADIMTIVLQNLARLKRVRNDSWSLLNISSSQ